MPEGEGTAAPVGTVALLFTDVEGSTQLATRLGDAWGDVLTDHHAIVGGAILAEGGWIDGTEGDAFFATFPEAAPAVRAAVAAQLALRAHEWPAGLAELRVRMGIHVGHVRRQATGYVGVEVHRAARVGSAAHGGQVLLTGPAEALVRGSVRTAAMGAHRLKDLPAPEALFAVVVDGHPAELAAPRTLAARPTNLPAARQPLVGRDAELQRVCDAVLHDGGRLVTLTGRGGSGKTSLALAAAHALLDAHPGGVWWVPLADVMEPAGVLDAVARVVGADAGPAAEAIAASLRRGGDALVVLDNAEQVLAAGPQLRGLLEAAPSLRLVVTSQLPLRVAGERRVALDALDGPAGAALMVAVLERLDSRAQPRPEDLEGIVAVLDGLPLALELAAARLGVLEPEALLERLRASTSVLRDRGGDRPERQRSLQATIEWSLGLLDADARALFDRFGAFAAPAGHIELEAVAGGDGLDVLDALESLLDAALVRRVDADDGSARFGLPEALRQVAAAALDAGPDGGRWRRAHAEQQLRVAWAARAGAFADAAPAAAARAGARDARLALDWAWAHEPPLARRLAAVRSNALVRDGRFREARELRQRLAADPGEDPVVLALAGLVDARLAEHGGHVEEAQRRYEAVLAAGADDPAVLLNAETGMAFNALDRGDPALALERFRGVTARAAAVSPAAYGCALFLQAQSHLHAGDLADARRVFTETERLARERPSDAAWAHENFLGDLAYTAGDHPGALEHYTRALTIEEAGGHRLQVTHNLHDVAMVLATLGREEAALEATGVALAEAADVLDEPDGAAPAGRWFGDGPIAAARDRLGDDRAAAALERGRAVPAGRRVAYACALAAA